MNSYNRSFDEIRSELFLKGLEKIAEGGTFRSFAAKTYQDAKSAVSKPYNTMKSSVYEQSFDDELNKLSFDVVKKNLFTTTYQEPGWKKSDTSNYYERGNVISDTVPTHKVSNIHFKRMEDRAKLIRGFKN